MRTVMSEESVLSCAVPALQKKLPMVVWSRMVRAVRSCLRVLRASIFANVGSMGLLPRASMDVVFMQAAK